MKTPLEELIGELQKSVNNSDFFDLNNREAVGIKRAIMKAYEYLQKEKEVIETAFEDGVVIGITEDRETYKNSEDYYNQTFKK